MGSFEAFVFMVIIWVVAITVPGILMYFILTWLFERPYKKVRNYANIHLSYTSLVKKIKFTCSQTETKKLEDDAWDFLVKYDNADSHKLVIRFYNNLMYQICVRQDEFRTFRNKQQLRLTILVFIIIIGMLNSCSIEKQVWHGGHCRANKGMTGF